jgi:hypothetical protein
MGFSALTAVLLLRTFLILSMFAVDWCVEG